MFQLHCTLRRLCDDCPNAATGWCGVGFLQTVVSTLPSLSGVIKMSKNGNDPSGFSSSVVNCMLLSTEFRWVRNSSL